MRQGKPYHKTSISQVKIGFRLDWTFLDFTGANTGLLGRWKTAAIHRINHNPVHSVVCFVNRLIHRMAIYPMDNVIQPTNNRGLVLEIG